MAKQCADRCDAHVEELKKLQKQAELLGRTDGYGTLPSAMQLGEKFKQLAVGGGSYYDLLSNLRDRIAVATEMGDVFRKIGDRYGQAEGESAAGIRRAGYGA
ncbi:hypothetical protein G4X40_14240 [Rhodococcus sp. D2-41]|uniref:Uncharacterized protein n=1 Tax=Speluncibacter jeojiensis TaxID=2710754 RepID=A0A9X4M656_9ACTN|nr:hypothetical protein [Rhodococcus sp. D2-41]MDG3011311.1 hypothetical protein [Rhodococcus sp. D2-41]MDG3016677.1 hypothetical protein [Corynebacteriales bacterium D3-21]